MKKSELRKLVRESIKELVKERRDKKIDPETGMHINWWDDIPRPPIRVPDRYPGDDEGGDWCCDCCQSSNDPGQQDYCCDCCAGLAEAKREYLKKESIEKEGRDFERERHTGKEVKKCWTCTPTGCGHSGSQQGARTADCPSWWSCHKSCKGRLDYPGW